jgi:hypothetical protein
MTSTLSDTGELRRVADQPTRNLTVRPAWPRRPDADETAQLTFTDLPAFPTGAEKAVADRLTRDGKVLVPLLRPAAPLGEYAEKRSQVYVRPAGAGGPGRHRRPSLLARLLGGAR